MAKIIVNRLKPLMQKLVSPYQSSFVPRRCIQDNEIIAREISHSMGRMGGRKGYMEIKIDLEKAYDIMSWGFLRNVLEEIQLPNNLVDLIDSCISSGSMNILWTGVKSDVFMPSRGVRQGDPLSPYLFVLRMEKLSHIIADEVETGVWRPLKLGRNGVPIST